MKSSNNLILPKVLIIGTIFDEKTGGGVTLSNLFKDWTIENIAVISIGSISPNLNKTICNKQYQLGQRENKKIFPLNLIQKKNPSGQLSLSKFANTNYVVPTKLSQVRKYLITSILYPFLHILGIYHISSKLILSDELLVWVKKFNPDLIYTQLGSLELIEFVKTLNKTLNIPLALHIMDDWPSSIVKFGLFKGYWQKKIEAEFLIVINMASILLTISENMAKEYKKRYSSNWISFHNPVELSSFQNRQKKSWGFEKPLKIGYTGRIGLGNKFSLSTICKVVDYCNKCNLSVELNIYSSNYYSRIAKSFNSYSHVNVLPPIPHVDIPKLLISFDVLFLPLDFKKKSLKFVKLSMPTKTTEYLFSGTPILAYASSETALIQYLKQNSAAYIVENPSFDSLYFAIRELYKNESQRQALGKRAQVLANKKHNSLIIRSKFEKTLCAI